jgi:hypothetical protein
MTLVTKLNYLFKIYREHGFREFLRIGWLGLWHHGANRLVLLALTKPNYVQRSSADERFYDFHFASVDELMEMKKNQIMKLPNSMSIESGWVLPAA